eukprot:14721048-Alexandrium_andersonii.AAC.1
MPIGASADSAWARARCFSSPSRRVTKRSRSAYDWTSSLSPSARQKLGLPVVPRSGYTLNPK